MTNQKYLDKFKIKTIKEVARGLSDIMLGYEILSIKKQENDNWVANRYEIEMGCLKKQFYIHIIIPKGTDNIMTSLSKAVVKKIETMDIE